MRRADYEVLEIKAEKLETVLNELKSTHNSKPLSGSSPKIDTDRKRSNFPSSLTHPISPMPILSYSGKGLPKVSYPSVGFYSLQQVGVAD